MSPATASPTAIQWLATACSSACEKLPHIFTDLKKKVYRAQRLLNDFVGIFTVCILLCIMIGGIWPSARCNQEHTTTKPPTHKEYTGYPKENKKQKHGDIPKKISENRLKTNSIFVNSFYTTANPRRRTTYNAGQKQPEFYINDKRILNKYKFKFWKNVKFRKILVTSWRVHVLYVCDE
jgi:hypothetical protein